MSLRPCVFVALNICCILFACQSHAHQPEMETYTVLSEEGSVEFDFTLPVKTITDRLGSPVSTDRIDYGEDVLVEYRYDGLTVWHFDEEKHLYAVSIHGSGFSLMSGIEIGLAYARVLEILGEPNAVRAEDGVKTLAVYRFRNPNVEQGPPISAIGEVELNISLIDGRTVKEIYIAFAPN